ncbi:hypothetical protein BC835DRAFT_1465714 [Cytidiella melzeri]|nr:hypothetical protein BC835DRAFT_1465714 [Cytidiella melzeri]
MPIINKKNKATECGVNDVAEVVVVGWKSKPIETNHSTLDVLFVELTSPSIPIKLDVFYILQTSSITITISASGSNFSSLYGNTQLLNILCCSVHQQLSPPSLNMPTCLLPRSSGLSTT